MLKAGSVLLASNPEVWVSQAGYKLQAMLSVRYSVQEVGGDYGFSGEDRQKGRRGSRGSGDVARGGRGGDGGGGRAGRGGRGGGRGSPSPQQQQGGGGGRGGGKLLKPPAVARRLFTSEAMLATEQPLWRYIDLQGAVQVGPALSPSPFPRVL